MAVSRDLSRLPKWAQDRITLLERQVGELRNAVSGRNGETTETDTWLIDYSNGDFALPHGAQVRFAYGDAKRHETIEATMSNGSLEIRSSAGCLVVRPQVSNAISVSVDKRS